MACGILLITHPGIGASILAIATALMRQLPLQAEAFEVPLDADLGALLPQASSALRRVDSGEGVLVLTTFTAPAPATWRAGSPAWARRCGASRH